MAMVTGQFERVAELVARRIAEILGVPVWIVNDRDLPIAAGDPVRRAPLPWPQSPEERETALRVPIHFDGHAGEVLIGRAGDGEALSPRVAGALIDLTLSQVAVVDQIPDRHELKNKFVLDLLRGGLGDAADVLREGQILGLDLTRPRAVILIDVAAFILARDGVHHNLSDEGWVRHSRLRLHQVINHIVSFFRLPTDAICAYIGGGEVVVLKASSTQDLVHWAEAPDPDHGMPPSWANLTALKRAGAELVRRLSADTGMVVNAGIGRYHRGIPGLARSYQDARTALSLGRQFHRDQYVHCLDELGIAALVGLSDGRTKAELAAHLLSPLDHEPELLETLEAFFAENCLPSPTAARLVIHRNTLGYRLEKIASLTGLDPRRFDDAVQIRLALVLRALQEARPKLGNCPTVPPEQSSALDNRPMQAAG